MAGGGVVTGLCDWAETSMCGPWAEMAMCGPWAEMGMCGR
jgi:hypothetical protein